MHSEIEAAEAHEIGHVHFVNCGTMIPFFVGYHKLARARGVTLPAS